jgi:D-glycero-D-manno-heptose 1,7-bisphosphate phosphatase
MKKNKAIFLDRDGVLNQERGAYTFRQEDFIILPGVPEALKALKEAAYYLIVITNQGGISRGLYSAADVWECHHYLQEQCGHLIDALYFAPYHGSISASLAAKPDSLMLEKAISKYDIEVAASWMIGDSERDIEAAQKVGLHSAWLRAKEAAPIALVPEWEGESLWDFTQSLLKRK